MPLLESSLLFAATAGGLILAGLALVFLASLIRFTRRHDHSYLIALLPVLIVVAPSSQGVRPLSRSIGS